MLASSLAFSFSSDSAANQSSTHTLRNKLLISAFVVDAAAADPNALFILRSCSKSKETTKKERNKEVLLLLLLLLLLIPTALLILRRCKRKKERKNERTKERKKFLSTYCWIPMLF
jgi:hypothetical protein